MRLSSFLVLLLALVISFHTSLAQSPQKKRKKLKDFGSSLKRLQWNPQKNAAVELPRTDPSSNSEEEDVIRIDTSLVTCELLVLDSHGNHVAGLTEQDFVIAEDNASQQVGHFLLGDNARVPRTIVLIIDYSDSQTPYLKDSITAAKVLVDKLNPNDLMAIVTDDVELLMDFSNDKKKLKNKLDSLSNRSMLTVGPFGVQRHRVGRSMQYSALIATLNEAFEDTDVRPIIVFQTDGDEVMFLRNSPVSLNVPKNLLPELGEETRKDLEQQQAVIREKVREFSLDDVYRAVEKSRATVYTMIPGTKLVGFTPKQQVERAMAARKRRITELIARAPSAIKERLKARLEEMSQTTPTAVDLLRLNISFKEQSALAGVAPLTGGWTEFLEQPEQADAIYSRIFSDINQRYIVGYYPTNKDRDGKRRKIDFAIKGHPEYQILGRRSYFAPTP